MMQFLSRSNLTSWTPLVEEVALAYAGNHTQDYEDAVQDGMVRLMEMATGTIPLPPRAKEWKPEHVFSQVRQAINSEYRKEATLPQSHTSESDIVLHNDDGSRIDGANEVLELLTVALEASDEWMSPIIPSSAPQFELSCGHTKGLLGQFSDAFGEKEPYAMCPAGCGEMKVGKQIKTAVGQPFSTHEVEEVHFQTNRDREFANPDTLMGSFMEDYEELPEPSTKSADVSNAQREKSYLLLDAYVQHLKEEWWLVRTPSRFGFEKFLKKLEQIGARLSVAYNTPPEHMEDVPEATLHDNPYHRAVVQILKAEGYVWDVTFTRFYSKKDKRMVPLMKLQPSDKLYKEGTYYLKDFLDEAFPSAPSDPGATHEQCIGTRRISRMDEWYAAIEGKKDGRYWDRSDFQVAKVKALLTGCGPWLANVLAYAHIFPYKGDPMPVKAIRGSGLLLENGSVISLAKAWRCWTGLRFGSSERKEKFCTLMEEHFPSNKNAKNLVRILRTN